MVSPQDESSFAVLEEWLKQLLEKPVETLNAKYPYDTVAVEELELLPLPKTRGYTVTSSHVSRETLYRLHEKLKGQWCESSIWDTVLWYLAHPLPVFMAHDLIDRGVSVIAMGITRQVDEVQWRMATFKEDALYTLVRERYVQPQYSVAQFETMLRLYETSISYEGILYMLSFFETPSRQKRGVYKKAVAMKKAEERERRLDPDDNRL